MYQTFADLMDQWPNDEELARAVRVKGGRVRKWRARNSIPPEFWNVIIADAAHRRIPEVTAQLMADLAEQRRQADQEAA